MIPEPTSLQTLAVAALALLRQREGDGGVTEFCAQPVVAAGRDDDELSPACDIAHRRRLAPGRQGRLPQFLAGRGVEGAQLVVRRRGDEYEAARGHDRSAEIRQAANEAERHRAKRLPPANDAGRKID